MYILWFTCILIFYYNRPTLKNMEVKKPVKLWWVSACLIHATHSKLVQYVQLLIRTVYMYVYCALINFVHRGWVLKLWDWCTKGYSWCINPFVATPMTRKEFEVGWHRHADLHAENQSCLFAYKSSLCNDKYITTTQVPSGINVQCVVVKAVRKSLDRIVTFLSVGTYQRYSWLLYR